jgi:predicted dehydrogenase
MARLHTESLNPKNMKIMRQTRRSFLQTAAAASLPFILPSSIWAATTKPNDKLSVGFIGQGVRGHYLLTSFLSRDEVQVVAVCDVDTTRREHARTTVEEHYATNAGKKYTCAAYNDFRELIARKDIDVVCIATSDHWHTIPTLAALAAGKDVFCEKPLTHTIHESIAILDAMKSGERVLQTGSMQRSMKEFRIACELVLNGAIGKIERVECNFGGPPIPCDLPEERLEPGLDWNLWLGPAPMRPYNSVVSPRGIPKRLAQWRKYREYGGGGVTDWGAHQLDIAQWGLGMDGSGPVAALPPDSSAAQEGAKLVYANGVTVEHVKGFGVDFFGTDGRVRVNRGKFVFEHQGKTIASFESGEKSPTTSCEREVAIAEKTFLKDAKIKLYLSKDHLSDFIASIKARTKPIASEQVGARSAICCHLLNQAYLHRQKIEWDPAQLAFAGTTCDPKWMTKEYRKPWSV